MRVSQAVFLVGGRGTRLGTITQHTPKPLLEIEPGVRFLDVLLENAARFGFTDILLLAGHMGDQVEQAYHDRQVHEARVRVVREASSMGTGGALYNAGQMLAPCFLVGNGDSLFDINLRALAMPLSNGVAGRLALRRVRDGSRFGTVRLQDNQIQAFHEKSEKPTADQLINAGLYMLDRRVVEAITGPCSLELDVFPALARSGKLSGAEFGGYFLDIGLPDTFEQAKHDIPLHRRRPIAFLDRDGVLNVDQGYTYRVDQLIWVDGAIRAIRRLNDAGYRVIVVTNQAGIGHGLYQEEDMQRFHNAMRGHLASEGAWIDDLIHCPFHPAAKLPHFRHENHPDRKPNPGMLMKAFDRWPSRISQSFLIGDKDIDVAAASASGIPGYLYQRGSLDVLVTAILAGIKNREVDP